MKNMIKVAQGLLGQEELDAVRQAFDYGYFGHAHYVEAFEQEVAKVCDIDPDMVAAVNNGTSALFLALVAAGIGKGDEVIVPSLTFVASFQAISLAGATPVPCDCRADDLSADPVDIERRITPQTKAIMPVHYCGHVCDMDAILALGKKYNLRVIEDAAHCFGGTYHDAKVGNYSDIACFSFDSIKVMTCGEGGAVVSHDKELIQRIKLQRLLSMDKGKHPTAPNGVRLDYDVASLGYRCHMSNINGAIGLVQIKKLDNFIARRREICRRYLAGMQGLPYIEFLRMDYDAMVPFMFIIRVKNGWRDDLKKYLAENDVESAIKYVPSHLLSFYQGEGASCPVTEDAFKEILELPLHCRLSDEDVEKVISAVKSFNSERENK